VLFNKLGTSRSGTTSLVMPLDLPKLPEKCQNAFVDALLESM
jgi:hypothetical protein